MHKIVDILMFTRMINTTYEKKKTLFFSNLVLLAVKIPCIVEVSMKKFL